MKYLIGDIGNTSTKLCILNKKFKIFKSYEFQTDKIYKGSFFKKARGRITFKCNQGEEVKKTVSLAIQKSKPQKIFMSSSGIDESGQKVSEFEFEWTILVKK